MKKIMIKNKNIREKICRKIQINPQRQKCIREVFFPQVLCNRLQVSGKSHLPELSKRRFEGLQDFQYE